VVFTFASRDISFLMLMHGSKVGCDIVYVIHFQPIDSFVFVTPVSPWPPHPSPQSMSCFVDHVLGPQKIHSLCAAVVNEVSCSD
jgi:hypothetical protein